MRKIESIYTPKSGKIIRIVGVLIPLFIIIYGILINNKIIHTFREVDSIYLAIFLLWWLLIGFLHFITPMKNDKTFGLYLIAYHLLAGSFLIFVSGSATPLVACWLILALFSYIHDSKRGFFLSLISLVIFCMIDIILWSGQQPVVIVEDVVAISVVILISMIALGISRTQEVSKSKLRHSQVLESLQRDQVSTIINNLADAILSIDMQGIVHIYNASSLGLLDTNTSLKGRHIDDVLPLFDQENNKVSIYKELQKARSVIKRDDLEYHFSDDEKMRLEITLSPIRSNYSRSKKAETHDGYIIIARDVTKAKSLEEERDEFISVVSHELRTPITVAEGALSNMLVMIDHPNVTNEMLKDSMNLSHDQIVFLASMVNDLSTLSRAERGAADTSEEIDVKELAHKLYDKYKIEAKTRHLHLDLDLAPKLGKVRVSRLYLEELLQNFITNALKYTREGGIKIIVDQKNDNVIFSVKDTGIGISKSDQTKIFNKFYRSEDYRTRETGGTGLGLYIADKLSRKIGARIQMTSRLNYGSTFWFSLPAVKDQKLD